MKHEKLNCKNCGKPFEPTNGVMKYCSVSCRIQASNSEFNWYSLKNYTPTGRLYAWYFDKDQHWRTMNPEKMIRYIDRIINSRQHYGEKLERLELARKQCVTAINQGKPVYQL